MAINTQKFLPSSTKTNVGGALVKYSQKFIGAKTEKLVEDIGIIKVTTIQIDSILKGTLAAEKKKLDQQKRLESSKRREKQEEKLETKPQAEKGQIKVPSVPRMGFLDWVKNFIGNIILGYFAVRILKYLPKIVPIIKFLGAATDFVLDTGGKLLDGLVSFVDWGYKAYDATNSFLKNLGGENFSKIFQSFSGALGTLIETSIIAATVVAGQGKDFFDGQSQTKPTPKGGKPKVTTGIGGKPKFKFPGTRPKITYGGGNKTLLSSVRPFLKRIPLPVIGALIDFGLSVALGEDPGRAAFKAIGAGLLGSVGAALGTVVPIAGNIIGGIVGGVLGDVAGAALYDLFFTGKKPQQKNQKIEKKAGGGITRGGKSRSGAKRTISKGKKQKYKRVLAPKKPGKVEIDSPGDSIGGEEKLFGIFPKPKLPDVINPFKVIKNTGEELGKTDYFGPILAISSKITAGQLPTQQDYKNAGVGINLLIAEGIRQNQLKGGLVAAFAEGGFVDPDVLSAAETGGDVSNWVARTFKGEIESNAQKTLRMIRENATKKPLSVEKDKSVMEISPDEELGNATEMVGGARLLMSAGFPPLAASILAGNIQAESAWRGQRTPWVLNDGAGTNKGLISWNRTRITNAEKFLGKPLETASNAEQIRWIKEELRQYGLLDEFMDPNRTEEQLKNDSYKYIGWGKLGDRWKYSKQIYTALQKGETGSYVPKTTSTGSVKPVGSNGKLNPSQLTTVQGGFQLRTDAAQAFQNASAAARKSGSILSLSSAYRSYEKQAALYADRANNPYPVAAPGTSNHGYGLAIDIPEGTPGHRWMVTNGMKYGWKQLPGDAVHFDFVSSSPLKSFHIGTNKINSREVIAKLLKDEAVLDVNTSESLRKIDPEIISKLNRASNVSSVMEVLQTYTDYEQSEPEIVYVPVPVPTPFPIDSGGYGGSGIVMRGSSNEDPFESLYKFG